MFYMVEMTEKRNVSSTYWVEADDNIKALELAEAGETVCEVEGTIQGVVDRVPKSPPEAVETVLVGEMVKLVTPDKQEGLDELVYDLKSLEAQEINNRGVEAQVRYLASRLGIKKAFSQVL